MPDEFPPPSAAAGDVAEPLPRFLLRDEPVELNAGRRTATVRVTNSGDRPIQVGSHYHFFEANRALRFDRAAAFGMRLNIAAGTAARFEPGDTREVELVALAGAQRVVGFSGLASGSVSTTGPSNPGHSAYHRALARGFLDAPARDAPSGEAKPIGQPHPLRPPRPEGESPLPAREGDGG